MKTKLFYYLFVSIALLRWSTACAQEDVHFSQFYETSILRNPALTGVFESDYKVGAYYRNQWSSVADPYQTLQMNVEGRISISKRSDDFLSFGIVGYYDVAGALNQKISSLYPAINYSKCIDPDKSTYMSVGFAAGYLQYTFDPSKATFNNQFVAGAYSSSNPSLETLPSPRMGLFDLGAGFNFNTCSGATNQVTYLIGVSGYHFTQPVFSYYRTYDVIQNIRWNVNAGLVWEISENAIFQGHANFEQQGTYMQVMAAALIGYRNRAQREELGYEFYGGVIYRYNDAIIPTAKLKYKNLSVGISYDVNISSLDLASNYQGGLEITANVIGFIPARSYYKKTVCPRFN